jgi:hypothetical protein
MLSSRLSSLQYHDHYTVSKNASFVFFEHFQVQKPSHEAWLVLHFSPPHHPIVTLSPQKIHRSQPMCIMSIPLLSAQSRQALQALPRHRIAARLRTLHPDHSVAAPNQT